MKTSLRLLTALLLLSGFQTLAKECAAPENKGAAPENKGERFAKLDTNGDGQLSLDEFKAGVPADKADKADKMFAKIDTNTDGAVSKDEMKQGGKEMHKNRAGKGGEGEGKGKGKGKGGQGKGKGGGAGG